MVWWINMHGDRMKRLAVLKEIMRQERLKGTPLLSIRNILDKHMKTEGLSYNSRLDYLSVVIDEIEEDL